MAKKSNRRAQRQKARSTRESRRAEVELRRSNAAGIHGDTKYNRKVKHKNQEDF